MLLNLLTMTSNTITAKEAAERLNISLKSVANYIKRGRFPGAYKLDPLAKTSAWRIPVVDIESFELARKGWVQEDAV